MDRYLRKSSRTASRIIDGEAVVVIPEEGRVNVFNPVGSRVWELLDGKSGLKDIAAIISGEFEVTYESAYQDVQEFMEDLSKKGMLTQDE